LAVTSAPAAPAEPPLLPRLSNVFEPQPTCLSEALARLGHHGFGHEIVVNRSRFAVNGDEITVNAADS